MESKARAPRTRSCFVGLCDFIIKSSGNLSFRLTILASCSQIFWIFGTPSSLSFSLCFIFLLHPLEAFPFLDLDFTHLCTPNQQNRLSRRYIPYCCSCVIYRSHFFTSKSIPSLDIQHFMNSIQSNLIEEFHDFLKLHIKNTGLVEVKNMGNCLSIKISYRRKT